MNELLTPYKKSAKTSVTCSKKTGSKELDSKIASYFYAAKMQPCCKDANTAKMPPEAWYEMYVKPWQPDLAMVGMCILSQVISASSCERNWSAHGHIHSRIRNRLEPATAVKLVYVYSNRKIVAATHDVDELKMFAWDNEDA